MAYIVTDKTGSWYLRGTVWAGAKERASRYATEAEAAIAITLSATFNPKAAKAARIVAEEGPTNG